MPRTRTPATSPLPALLLAALFLTGLAVAPSSALDLFADSPPSSTPSISKGDPVVIRGTATGHPSNGLQIWLIGTNYARVGTTSVEPDNTFAYEISSAATQNLAAGQYFVLVQHPMMNGEFDITYHAGTGAVINQRMNGGKTLFRLTGAGSLPASDAASSLVGAVASQNIDDSFTSLSFFVAEPSALIDPIGQRAAGDTFTITGSTNLAAGESLLIDIYSSSFRPTQKSQSGEFSGTSGIVPVVRDAGGYNRWSLYVDTSTWRADEYIVSVTAVSRDVSDSTTFVLAEQAFPSTPVAPATSIPPVTEKTTVTMTEAPAATATQQSPPGGLALPAALLAAALFPAIRRNL